MTSVVWGATFTMESFLPSFHSSSSYNCFVPSSKQLHNVNTSRVESEGTLSASSPQSPSLNLQHGLAVSYSTFNAGWNLNHTDTSSCSLGTKLKSK